MKRTTIYSLLFAILVFALFSRLYLLSRPTSYYFDEVYHVVTAKAYAINNPAGYEWWHSAPEPNTAYEWLHPPIAKLFMAGGIKLFGVNAFAWRFPGVLFGVITIYLTFVLARRLTKNYIIALLAAFLASLDGLLLAQSRIAMNDVYVTAFMVATLNAYLSWLQTKKTKDIMLTSLFVGLAISTKWSGVFLVGIIGCLEGFMLVTSKITFSVKRYAKLFLALIIIPLCIYGASYGQFFMQGHSMDQFRELHRQIIAYQFNLEATHSYQSKAWQWPLLIRPVWQHVDYSIPNKIGNIYAMGNPLLSWFGLIATLWYVYAIVTNKKYQDTKSLAMTVSYFAVWVPWVFSPRIMFYYHYTPAIPFLCIILASALYKLHGKSEIGQSLAVNSVGLIVLAFMLFYPHWVGMPISKVYSDWLFWLPTWR